MMIRVACLLLLSARALAAPAAPASLPGGELPAPGRAELQRDVPGDLLVRTMWKFKRNAPAENPDSDHVSRKQFIVKLRCQKDKCAHTQVYEFDLLGVKPGAGRNGVYY